ARSRPDRNGSRPSVLVVALEQRARPARSQRVLGCRFFSRVHERKMAEPARCRGQNRTPEGRIAEAEPDGGALTLELELTGCHRIQRDDEIVQPAGAGKADVVRRLQNGSLACQCTTRGSPGHEGQVLLGRDPGPATEQAVEMKLRQPGLRGDLLEAGLLAIVLVDERDGPRDTRKVAAV